MTISPETEIVGTSYDAVTHTHSYTIEKHGKRWTVAIPDAELAQFGRIIGAQAAVNKARRRAYMAQKLTEAMRGDPDE